MRIKARCRAAIETADRDGAGRRRPVGVHVEAQARPDPAGKLSAVQRSDLDRHGGDEIMIERGVVILDRGDQCSARRPACTSKDDRGEREVSKRTHHVCER